MNSLNLVTSPPPDGPIAPAVRLAIIGCGYWGLNYVRVFGELPGASVVAVCEHREDRRRELSSRISAVALYSTLDDLLHNENFDAAVICTEATSHFNVARRCLEAGKHALIEKPITTTSEDADALTALASANSRILMVGHTFLYNAGIRKVKELVDAGPHRVYYMHACRTNLGPIRRDVNAMWDLATHDVAIFNYLLGDVPEWVSAVGAKVLRNCREDVGFVSLGYRDGVIGHIHVSWADPNKAREVVVVCSDKRIVFNDLNGLEQVRVFEKAIFPVTTEPETFGEYRLQVRDGDILSPHIEPHEPLKEQCRHFLQCVRTGEVPLTDGRDGSQVLRVLEAIDRSMHARGAQMEVSSREDSIPAAA
jgi:predicted dehydrogenase